MDSDSALGIQFSPARKVRSLDRVVFRSALVEVGAFRCRPGDPRFRDSGPIQNQVVVFPRRGVWICHAGSRPFVADPQIVTIYNQGQEYTRESISPDGDRCDWFAVTPALACEIAMAYDARVEERPDRPYVHEFAPCTTDLYMRQRRLFLKLSRPAMDPLEAEEAVMGIVAEVVRAASDAPRVTRRTRRGEEARRNLVERARAEIMRDISARVSVASLAERLGTSPFHLCRVFAAQTGESLHEYRLELRLRMLLEYLAEPNVNLSRLAMDLGFSSHSHLTATIRRRVGLTPSALRRMLT